MSARPSISRAPIVPERVRRIDGQSFGFVPHRFLRDGFYASLTRDEVALYLLLVLAGDRNGVSYYHYDSLSSLLRLDPDSYVDARDGLIDKDLVAFDGTRFQVLSLPQIPARGRAPTGGTPLSGSDQAAIRRSIREALQRNLPGGDDVR